MFSILPTLVLVAYYSSRSKVSNPGRKGLRVFCSFKCKTNKPKFFMVKLHHSGTWGLLVARQPLKKVAAQKA